MRKKIIDSVVFVVTILFVLCVLCVKPGYCLNLDKVKVYFLQGDYKNAAAEGEKILSGAGNATGLDELYYLLALSYLKSGNYLRAADIFEIILKEFKDSRFQEEAELGLGDACFLRGDFTGAEKNYRELLRRRPRTKFKAQLYYRLSEVGFKKGDLSKVKDYLDKLKTEFPGSSELALNKDLAEFSGPAADIYYTVQVGSFANSQNARNLCNKLIKNGYDAYLEEAGSRRETTYRVRVGKLKSRTTAAQLESRLAKEGYPTKICP